MESIRPAIGNLGRGLALSMAAVCTWCAARPAAAAPQDEPSKVEAARNVIDLAKFPVPQAAQARQPRRLAQLDYFTQSKPAAAFAEAKKELEKSGCKELPGGYSSDEYASGTFQKQNYLISVSSSSGTGPDDRPATNVHLMQHGNVDLEKLPKPSNLETVYVGPVSAIYTSPQSVDDATKACVDALTQSGWARYSDDTQPMSFKKNAIRLTLFVVAAPAQQDKTSVTYSTELMSVELDPPPELTRNSYADNLAAIHFDTKLSIDDTIQFYREHLGSLGWKATTDNPVKIDLYDTLIFRNADKDLLTLSLDDVEGGITRGSLTHQSAAEVAAEEEAFKTMAEEKAKADEAMERARAANKLAVPLPAAASQVEVTDSRIEFQLPSGKSAAPLKALRTFLTEAGWKEDVVSDAASASVFSYSLNEARIELTCVDPGFIPAEVTLSSSGITLHKK